MKYTTKQKHWKPASHAAAASLFFAIAVSPAFGAPIATGGYSISAFAQGTSSYKHPDSIAVADGSVYVIYTNNVAPDGTDGKSSTLVQYNMSGSVMNQTSLLGSADGLKYDSANGLLWANHNEDGNAFVTWVNPSNLAQSAQYKFNANPHGGGYDDVAFLNGKTYVSASNPSVNASNQVNGAPSIASVQLTGSQAVVSGVFANNATVTNIATGASVKSNQTDPDSMITTPTGGLLLDSQGDGQLYYVGNVGTSKQTAGQLTLVDSSGKSVMVDDTVFPSTAKGFVLVSDPTDNTVWKVSSSSFTVNGAYSGGNSDSFGIINQSTGLYTPFISGLGGASGEAFVSSATPEPSTIGFIGLALAGFGCYRARRASRRA